MKRFLDGLSIAALVVAIGAGLAVASPGKGALDGKTFDVQIQETGKPATPDQLVFESGSFVSTACVQHKFEKAAYAAKQAGAATTFEAKTTSPTDGTILWKGTVSGASVNGTMEWTPKSGKKETHAFSGALATPAATLDGKSFEIQISAQGKEPHPDKLVFGSGLFESTQCDQYGFTRVSYSASPVEGAMSFQATATSETDGMTTWQGRVRGDAIEGTMEWTPKTGDKVVHTFSGMTVARREGPAKPLEGKTFAVTLGEVGKEMQPDDLIFGTGMFESTGCRQFGYTRSTYRSNTAGNVVTFESKCMSPTDGTTSWTGTVRGDAIEGTMMWEKTGKTPVKYAFSGTLKK